MSDSTYKLIQNSSTGTTTDIQLCNYTVNGSTGSMANITSAINYTDNDLQVLNTEPFIDVFSAIKVNLMPSEGLTGSEQFVSTTGEYSNTDPATTKSDTVQLLDTSTSLIQSRLDFQFSDGPTGVTGTNGSSATISFDTTDSNYNMFKAVNSALERTDDTNGISLVNSVAFNHNVSLLWDGPITRDATTHGLTGTIGYSDSTPTQQSADYYNLSIPTDASNNETFIGSMKFSQDAPVITIPVDTCTSTSTLQSITNAVTESSVATGLTGQLSVADFNALFSASDLLTIGDGYTFGITGSHSDGGYSFESTNGDFTLDDSAILANQSYMSQCADATTWPAHTIQVTNGSLSNETIPEYNGLNGFSVSDVDEELGSVDAASSIEVTIAPSVPSDTSRRTFTSSSSFTNPDIYYSGDAGAPSHLSQSDCENYDVVDTLTCLLSSTTLGAAGPFALGATGQNIGQTGIFASMYQTDNDVAPTDFSDLHTTFSYTAPATTPSTGYANTDIVFINLQSNYDITDTDIMTDFNNVGITGAAISVFINNDYLLETFPQNTSSRLKLTAKGLTDLSAFTNSTVLAGTNPIGATGQVFLTSDTRIISSSDETYGNLMDTNIESMIQLDHATSVQLNIQYVTNGSAQNKVGLTRQAIVSYTCTGETTYTGSLTYNEYEMTYTDKTIVSTTTTQITTLPTGYTLPVNTELYQVTDTVTYTVHIPLQWSCASNMEVQIPVTEVSKFYLLKNTVTGLYLPKQALSTIYAAALVNADTDAAAAATAAATAAADAYAGGSGAGAGATAAAAYAAYAAAYSGGTGAAYYAAYAATLAAYAAPPHIATRSFSSTSSVTSLDYSAPLTVSDLYLFQASIEMSSDDGTNWSSVTPTAADLDVVYNSISSISITHATVTATATASISIDSMTTLGSSTYYICQLNTAKGTQSYTATGRKYSLSDAPSFDGWAGPYSSSGPSGLSVGSLTLTTDITQEINSFGVVTQTTLTVTDSTGYTYTFIQTNPTMYCNFNIFSCQTPLFKNVKTGTSTTGTTYMFGIDDSRVKVDEGIYANYTSNLLIGDSCTITLLGQNATVSLYTSYAGTYHSGAEITQSYESTTSTISRNVTFNAYRGIDSGATTFTRTIGSFYLNVPTTIINSSHGQSDLFIGAISTDSVIGLKITSAKSYYNPSNFQSVITVAVKFDSYTYTITNPYSSTNPSTNITQTVSASENVIYAFYNISLCAERVLIYDSESWSVHYAVPDLKVYYSDTYVGDPTDNSFTWTQVPLTYSYASLLSGFNLPASTASLAADGLIQIQRSLINVQESTSYLMCSPPQFLISAYCAYDISSLPYNPSSVQARSIYQDITLDVSANNNPFYGDSQMNNITVTYTVDLSVSYYVYRYGTSSEDIAVTFPISSNKVDIEYKIFNGSTYVSFSPKKYAYQGAIDQMESVGSSFLPTLNDTDRTVGFSYSQPVDTILVNSTSDALNVKVENIPYFGTGAGTLKLIPDNRIDIEIFGKTIDYNGDTPAITFSKYTIPSIDYNYLFDTYPANVNSTIKLNFLATGLQTFTTTIPEYGNLTSSPFNMTTYINTNLPSSTAWSVSSSFTTRQLSFNLEALSSTGLAQMSQILAVTSDYPEQVLLLNRPDITNILRPDGTSVYRITADGFVTANSMAANTLTTSQVQLITNASLTQNTDISFTSITV